MKLIINISKENTVYERSESVNIIDLSGSLISDYKLSLSEIVDVDDLYQNSLKRYQDFASQLALNDFLLSLKVNSLPIYWVTDTSTKNPIYHWGKDFFMMIELLYSAREIIEAKYKEVELLLPRDISKNTEPIRSYISSELTLKTKLKIQLLGSSSEPSFLTVFLALIKSSIKFFLYKPQVSNQASRNIFLSLNSTLRTNKNSVYHGMKQLFEENNNELDLVLLGEWQSKKADKAKLSSEFVSNKPSLLNILGVCYQSLATFRKSKQLTSQTIEVGKLKINLDFLRVDIRDKILKRYFLVLSHLWLKRTFSKMQQKKFNVFYEDEFYPSGKTFSHASSLVNNSFIKTYGVQHGYFDRIHTVYAINDIELKRGLPAPDQFIVWGDFFRKSIQSYNALSNDYFHTLGNPLFINRVNKEKKEYSLSNDNDLNLLWCTTTFGCFQLELEILKNSRVGKSKLKILVRLHPKSHVKESTVHESLKSFDYEIDKESSIYTSIENADIIICSAHSTVFLETLIKDKTVFRLFTNRWVIELDNGENIRDIRSGKDFDDALDETLAKKENKGEKAYDLLYLKPDRWAKFIMKTNA